MTEESFQQCRKVMQQINYLRGIMTKEKGNVAKWTKIEDCYKRDLKEGQAAGAKKQLDKALARLHILREKFAAISFPDSNLKPGTAVKKECQMCGAPMPDDKQNYAEYCNSCSNSL